MIIITQENKVAISVLNEMAQKMFDNLVKAVVDVNREIMAIDGELHADEEVLLMENGSTRADVWGINIYPQDFGQEKFIEFDSMINIKPFLGNRNRGVDDPEIRNRILETVKKLIIKDDGA